MKMIRFLLLLISFLSVSSHADTWVTLKDVDVDRCASAWLIKRFIDPNPEFIFFEQGDEPPEGTGYDFFVAEYFHKGADCTFTTLIKTYELSQDKALQQMNDDVNDVFSWRWRPGTFPVKLREHIGELRQRGLGDMRVYEDLYATFDLLYLSYGGQLDNYCFDSNTLEQTLFLRTIMPVIASDNNAAEYSENAILINVEAWQKKLSAITDDSFGNIPPLPDRDWCKAMKKLSSNGFFEVKPSSSALGLVLFRRQLICD